MNYKNNREAKLGDPVIGIAKGKHFTGTFAAIATEAQTLKQRLSVLVHTHMSPGEPTAKSTYASQYLTVEAEDAMHAEDVAAQFFPMTPPPAAVETSPDAAAKS